MFRQNVVRWTIINFGYKNVENQWSKHILRDVSRVG